MLYVLLLLLLNTNKGFHEITHNTPGVYISMT